MLFRSLLVAWLACCPAATWAAVTCSELTSNASGVDATSFSTASVSPTSNALVLLAVKSHRSSPPATTPTASGNSLTYVQIATVTFDTAGGADLGRVTLFRALGASPSAGVITIDFASVSQSHAGWKVIECTGVDTSGTDGSGAVVQSSTGTKAVSTTAEAGTLSAFGDATNNVGFATFGLADSATTFDVEMGWTELGAEQAVTSPTARLAAMWRTGQDTTPTGTWGASDDTNGIAVEVKMAVVATARRGTLLGILP